MQTIAMTQFATYFSEHQQQQLRTLVRSALGVRDLAWVDTLEQELLLGEMGVFLKEHAQVHYVGDFVLYSAGRWGLIDVLAAGQVSDLSVCEPFLVWENTSLCLADLLPALR